MHVQFLIQTIIIIILQKLEYFVRQAVIHSERVIAFIFLSKLSCHLQECKSLQPSDGVQHDSMTSEGVT